MKVPGNVEDYRIESFGDHLTNSIATANFMCIPINLTFTTFLNHCHLYRLESVFNNVTHGSLDLTRFARTLRLYLEEMGLEIFRITLF